MHVCFLQCGPSLRANGCDVIARKFMALDDHLVLLLPEFCAGSNEPKRDCLTAQSPGPPNSARQISFDLLFEIACSSLILISETGGQVIVSPRKIFVAVKIGSAAGLVAASLCRGACAFPLRGTATQHRDYNRFSAKRDFISD